MAQILGGAHKASWFQSFGKGIAVAASTGAAIVSILTALFSSGVLGTSDTRQAIGNLGAAWVRLAPLVDTAHAVGDTIHYAATIADKNGSILVGARPTWTIGDSSVAGVGTDGAVVARGPGMTTVNVVVGSLVAHARIVVQPRVAGVVVSSAIGDTAFVLPEDSKVQLRARGIDARGHTVARSEPLTWHVDDTTVAGVDERGVITGRNAGRTVVSASIGKASGYLGISVVMTVANLDAVAGTDQRALAGQALPQRVVIRATNRRGLPAAGKTVSFRSNGGGGSANPANAVTDADGRARTTWTLGEDPGRQTLLASVENLDSTVAVVAEADPIGSRTRMMPVIERLRAAAGALLSDSVAVRVTDTTGRPLANVPVRWTALDGGSADGEAQRTDSLGVARARWTLATRTGNQRLRAQIGGPDTRLAPVTITALALAGPPHEMTVVSGDGQRARAGATLARPVVIRVVDARGNGAADVRVVLSPSAGSVPDTAILTDSLGNARTQWTMGRSAGAHTLGVHVDGIKKLLKLTATARPAVAANLAFDDAPAKDKSARGSTRRLTALVTDIYGNPVPEAPVSFAAKSGTVTPARAVTDARGRVQLRWLLGTRTGEQTLTGLVRGTDVKGAYLTQMPTAIQAGKATPSRPRQR